MKTAVKQWLTGYDSFLARVGELPLPREANAPTWPSPAYDLGEDLFGPECAVGNPELMHFLADLGHAYACFGAAFGCLRSGAYENAVDVVDVDNASLRRMMVEARGLLCHARRCKAIVQDFEFSFVVLTWFLGKRYEGEWARYITQGLLDDYGRGRKRGSGRIFRMWLDQFDAGRKKGVSAKTLMWLNPFRRGLAGFFERKCLRHSVRAYDYAESIWREARIRGLAEADVADAEARAADAEAERYKAEERADMEAEARGRAEAKREEAEAGRREAEEARAVAEALAREQGGVMERLIRMEETMAALAGEARGAFLRGAQSIFDAGEDANARAAKLIDLCKGKNGWAETLQTIFDNPHGTQSGWARKLGVSQSTMNERIAKIERTWRERYPKEPPLLLRPPKRRGQQAAELWETDGAEGPDAGGDE